jgi:hypothetical protein
MGTSKKSGPRQLEPEAPSSEGEEAQAPEPGRRGGPLETLFQEAVRRAAALGLSGFFLTEEAVRRALSDSVPKEWADYISRQSEEVRSDLVDRLAQEFGAWLRTLDLSDVLRNVLEDYDLSGEVKLSAHPKQGDSTAPLQVLRRRK